MGFESYLLVQSLGWLASKQKNSFIGIQRIIDNDYLYSKLLSNLMYPIKKLIVCLDQSPLDQTLIAFAGFIAKVNQVKKIYFTNVIKNFSLPKELQEFQGHP